MLYYQNHTRNKLASSVIMAIKEITVKICQNINQGIILSMFKQFKDMNIFQGKKNKMHIISSMSVKDMEIKDKIHEENEN